MNTNGLPQIRSGLIEENEKTMTKSRNQSSSPSRNTHLGFRNQTRSLIVASNNEDVLKTQEEWENLQQQLASLTYFNFDTDLYGASDKDSYNTSISANEDEEILESVGIEAPRRISLITGHKSHFIGMPSTDTDNDGVDGGIGFRKPRMIINRKDKYQRRRLNQPLSSDRDDAFTAGKKMSDPSARTYAYIMRKEALKKEQEETLRAILILKRSIEIPNKDAVNRLGLLLHKVEGIPLLLVLDDVGQNSVTLIENFQFQISYSKILVTSRVAVPNFSTCVLKLLDKLCVNDARYAFSDLFSDPLAKQPYFTSDTLATPPLPPEPPDKSLYIVVTILYVADLNLLCGHHAKSHFWFFTNIQQYSTQAFTWAWEHQIILIYVCHLNIILPQISKFDDKIGGYYDADDNVKFGLPMAFTTIMLPRSVIEFGGLTKSEFPNTKEDVRWATCYLLKATAHPNIIYVQVNARSAFKVNANTLDSEVVAENIAALTATSLVFRRSDPTYAKILVAATMVGQIVGDKIKEYIRASENMDATIEFKGTVISVSDSPSAPRIPSFSSRGPNYRTSEILIPYVIAHGVNILAGWIVSHFDYLLCFMGNPTTSSDENGEYDTFGASHGCNNISSARDIKGRRDRIVAVISNWKTVAGQVYEAMGNAGYLDSNIVVIFTKLIGKGMHELATKVDEYIVTFHAVAEAFSAGAAGIILASNILLRHFPCV